jgi:hypothetical protein
MNINGRNRNKASRSDKFMPVGLCREQQDNRNRAEMIRRHKHMRLSGFSTKTIRTMMTRPKTKQAPCGTARTQAYQGNGRPGERSSPLRMTRTRSYPATGDRRRSPCGMTQAASAQFTGAICSLSSSAGYAEATGDRGRSPCGMTRAAFAQFTGATCSLSSSAGMPGQRATEDGRPAE